jgi:hypothetical protein
MTAISFCIATARNHTQRIQRCIDNISSLNIPKYEIIFCGGETTEITQSDHIKHIPFDETIRPRWITRKKNLAVNLAKYEVCIVIHDYILFDQNWYNAFEEFGTDWDICHPQSLAMSGERLDGWRIHQYPGLPLNCMVPYDVEGLGHFMAVQGNYHCIKRARYLKNPYDEEFSGFVADEMHWSKYVVPGSYVKCNPNCIIYYGKHLPEELLAGARQTYQEMLSHNHIFQPLRDCRIANWKPRSEGEARTRNDPPEGY